MIETARNLAGSYRDPERLTTVQYPEEKLAPKENTRTFPFLVYDGDDPIKGLRCTACTICEKECPPQCIYIVKETAKKPDYLGKQQFYPKVFDIDFSVCMGCGICVEFCPFESIKMDNIHEVSTDDRFDGTLVRLAQLAKPNSYYGEVHPTEAAEVDAARAAEVRKAEAKAKADAEAKAKAAAEATAKAAAAPATPATNGVTKPAPPPVAPAQPPPTT